MRDIELWVEGGSHSSSTATRLAQQAEAEGWDGLAFGDSPNTGEDVYVDLALAAMATSRLKLATGVAVPLTRNPATTAAAIATIKTVSDGRAVLGTGRGDSALAHLGLGPVSLEAFEHYLQRVQGYLRGEELPFDPEGDGAGAAPPLEVLRLADAPSGSRIQWLEANQKKVPVEVAASGPKVIAIAARNADRVSFAVGADPRRVRWAIEEAQAACEATGRDPATFGLGAMVPVLVHPDQSAARRLIAAGVATYARFSVMYGKPTGPVGNRVEEALRSVHSRYSMQHHFSQGSPQSRGLPDEFLDDFGIAGPPDYCVDRLRALAELGLTKLVLLVGILGSDPEIERDSRRSLVDVVLPSLA